jgi:hypothetical protein
VEILIKHGLPLSLYVFNVISHKVFLNGQIRNYSNEISIAKLYFIDNMKLKKLGVPFTNGKTVETIVRSKQIRRGCCEREQPVAGCV